MHLTWSSTQLNYFTWTFLLESILEAVQSLYEQQ
jgi:hypothetical protein